MYFRTSYLATGQVKILLYLPGGQVKKLKIFLPLDLIFTIKRIDCGRLFCYFRVMSRTIRFCFAWLTIKPVSTCGSVRWSTTHFTDSRAPSAKPATGRASSEWARDSVTGQPSLVIPLHLLFVIICSGTPLVRPPLLHQKSGLSRGVASRQG